MALRSEARHLASIRQNGALRMHVDMAAFNSMQGREERDDSSSPIYPFDSGVDDNSVTDTAEGSRKSFNIAVSPHAPNGFHKDNTFGGFPHNRTTLGRDNTKAQALTLSLDIPDTYDHKSNMRFSENATNRKTARMKRQQALGKTPSMADSKNPALTQRSLVACEDDNSSQKPPEKASHRKNLQWMDFKSSVKSQAKANRSHNFSERDGFMNGENGRRNSVINPDDWGLIEREMKRYEAQGKDSEKELKSLFKTISMAHNFHRLDWRMLVKSLGEEESSNGDFFSIYSWSTRKKIAETHPLTAYIREHTDITSEQLQKELHIGNCSSPEEEKQKKSRRSRRNVSGPSGGKYIRTPRGYNFKKEKTKTPGEVAILEARVKNSVGKDGTFTEGNASQTVTSSRERTVQLPDIHLPRTISNTETLFRRFIPGKTIKSQAGNKTSPGAFDFPLQVKRFSGLPSSPANSNAVIRSSTGGSVVSSFDDSLPMLHAHQRTNLVTADSSEELGRTLNTSTIIPVPRQPDKQRGQMAALTYQNRYRKGTPPKPPPATPVSHHVPHLENVDEFVNQYDSMIAHRSFLSKDGSRASSRSLTHSRGPEGYECLSVRSSSNTSFSSLASTGSNAGSFGSVVNG